MDAEQRRALKEHGYLRIKGALSLATVAQLNEAFERQLGDVGIITLDVSDNAREPETFEFI